MDFISSPKRQKNTLLKKEAKQVEEEGTDGALGKSSNKPIEFDHAANAGAKEGDDREKAKNAIALALMIFILLIRPQGIFGRKERIS